MIKPLMLCPSNMRVISSKHSLILTILSANDNGGGGGDDDDDDDGFD